VSLALFMTCGSLLGANTPQWIRRRCVSQRDRKIYALDADMPQRIRRFIRPGATETAVFDGAAIETAVSAVCQRLAGPGRQHHFLWCAEGPGHCEAPMRLSAPLRLDEPRGYMTQTT
jgi:hypothetical protein